MVSKQVRMREKAERIAYNNEEKHILDEQAISVAQRIPNTEC